MKKTLLIALMAIVATSTVITAQDVDQRSERRGPNPEKRIEQQVKRLDKKLKLNDEQKQQLKELYGEFDKAQKARMEQIKRAEMKEREALNSKIKSILTDEQKAKYEELKENEKEVWKQEGKGFGRGYRHGAPGRGPGRMGRGNHGGHGGFGGQEALEMNE